MSDSAISRAVAISKIERVSLLCRLSVEETENTILVLEAYGPHFVKAAEAGKLLRKAFIACSHTPYREEEPKKPVFFQRDIVPSKKRRFGI